MGSKWALLIASVVSAEEISIGVFGLFRPETLVRRDTTTSGEIVLEMPGRISRRFRGKFDAKSMAVRMDLETAVAAVVAAEMPNGAPPEVLKALAILARSYYTSATGRHQRYDFCDTTHCQFHRETPAPGHPASKAASDTAGVIVSYRGRPFAPMYSASCGGATFRAEDVGLSSEPYPYESVRCEQCIRTADSWTRTLPHRIARTEAARLEVVRKSGWAALPSNNYRPTADPLVITGRGQGHGVGVCQRGAIGMAAMGADFRSILRHYLPGTTLTDRQSPGYPRPAEPLR